jgi:UDP-GlcNAc3NAcA epimerase
MSRLRVLTVIGARPQFIKAAAFSTYVKNNLEDSIEETIVHTGQHYDERMSQIFFEELSIPKPSKTLTVNGRNHGEMTGEMLGQLEQIMVEEMPDIVLVYGDTNSTLAGALAASKLKIKIAHVEAGMRSFNMNMPEEINRVLVDRISNLNLAPSLDAIENLRTDGLAKTASLVGDIMYDSVLLFKEKITADSKYKLLDSFGISENDFFLVTCHRAENTDSVELLSEIVEALSELAKTKAVVLPGHPRLLKQLDRFKLREKLGRVQIIEPQGFIEMLTLQMSANTVVTDSGGMQKEAMYLGTPCVTIRRETEWVETVQLGWNTLAGPSASDIIRAVNSRPDRGGSENPYGSGDASRLISEEILSNFKVPNSK